jgi:N-terminal half of MaoC dehydratase
VAVDRFPVEATHILMFARAIGEPDAAYLDTGDGVVAPPTFAVAGSQFDPDNPLRPKPPEPWFGSGREPSGAHRERGGVLHAEQHFEYHAPLRAGTVLTAETRPGESWERQSKRAGTLQFSEAITEYRDAESGDLVVTARMVTVKTERPVSQGS